MVDVRKLVSGNVEADLKFKASLYWRAMSKVLLQLAASALKQAADDVESACALTSDVGTPEAWEHHKNSVVELKKELEIASDYYDAADLRSEDYNKLLDVLYVGLFYFFCGAATSDLPKVYAAQVLLDEPYKHGIFPMAYYKSQMQRMEAKLGYSKMDESVLAGWGKVSTDGKAN